MIKYFRIPIDNYYEAVTHTRKPKYAGAFYNYSAVYSNTFAYVQGEVKEEYYEKLIAKDDVSEFRKEDFNTAIARLS